MEVCFFNVSKFNFIAKTGGYRVADIFPLEASMIFRKLTVL